MLTATRGQVSFARRLPAYPMKPYCWNPRHISARVSDGFQGYSQEGRRVDGSGRPGRANASRHKRGSGSRHFRGLCPRRCTPFLAVLFARRHTRRSLCKPGPSPLPSRRKTSSSFLRRQGVGRRKPGRAPPPALRRNKSFNLGAFSKARSSPSTSIAFPAAGVLWHAACVANPAAPLLP